MAKRSEHDEEMGIGAKLTLGLVLWKVAKGAVKLGAMAGAAILGWRLVSRMFDRGGEAQAPAVA